LTPKAEASTAKLGVMATENLGRIANCHMTDAVPHGEENPTRVAGTNYGTIADLTNVTVQDPSNPSVLFAGTARSIGFGGVANQIVFDDVTFGTDVPGEVPEPGTLALLGLGLVGAAAARRRKA